MNFSSSEVLVELEAILSASNLFDTVTSSMPIVPISQELNATAAYITFTNTVPELNKNLTSIDGYDLHGFYLITCNVDCIDNKYRVYDVLDSVQRSILNDDAIWNKLVDRNLISVEYDNAEFYPKRSATLILEVLYRLSCS
jgi:hypothetical protein